MDFQSVVIDTGSDSIRAGFGGDDVPHTAFPSLVGRLRSDSSNPLKSPKDRYIGFDAQEKRSILSLNYPRCCELG